MPPSITQSNNTDLVGGGDRALIGNILPVCTSCACQWTQMFPAGCALIGVEVHLDLAGPFKPLCDQVSKTLGIALFSRSQD